MKIEIFNLNKESDNKKLALLKNKFNPKVIPNDQYIEEIVKVRNPHISDEKVLSELRSETRASIGKGYAVYYPWKNVICLIPSKKIFYELVTSRNKHLITVDEQQKLRDTTVAFFGMSVGSQAGLTWMLESRADNIKIVDFDTISPTNLNRIRFGVDSIGEKKVDSTSKILYEINPFAKINSYSKSEIDQLDNIVNSSPKASIIVDEIDDIKAKYELRKIAKKSGIPLVSAADVGDNVVLDVERYDIDRNTQPFLGRLPEIGEVNLDTVGRMELLKMIIRLVGFEADSDRIPESIMSIGGSLRTWPQLGATATIAGGVVTTTLKKIICGEEVLSGRYYFSLDRTLEKDYDSFSSRTMRSKKVKMVSTLLSKA